MNYFPNISKNAIGRRAAYNLKAPEACPPPACAKPKRLCFGEGTPAQDAGTSPQSVGEEENDAQVVVGAGPSANLEEFGNFFMATSRLRIKPYAQVGSSK
jgi:hypothetical protein